MTPTAGTYDLGPAQADLLLDTTCEGAMKAMGHDLTLVVEDWHGILVVGTTPEESSLRVTANLESLRVRDSHGGAKPASKEDWAKIEQNAASGLGVAQYPELTFTSTAVAGDWQSGTVEGNLTLHGQTEIQSFQVSSEGAVYTLTGEIIQSRYGVKPFSTMMGALRLGDAVTVRTTLSLEG